MKIKNFIKDAIEEFSDLLDELLDDQPDAEDAEDEDDILCEYLYLSALANTNICFGFMSWLGKI